MPEARPGAYVVALSEEAEGRGLRARARAARCSGVATDLDYARRSAKGQMTQAGRSGARYAFILGEQEVADQAVTARDLRAGQRLR